MVVASLVLGIAIDGTVAATASPAARAAEAPAVLLAPDVTIDSGPADGSFVPIPGGTPSSTVSVTFTFTGGPGTTQFACSVDGANYVTCDDATPGDNVGSRVVTLPAGIHSFQVKAGNAAGEFTPSSSTPKRQWLNTLNGDTFVDDSGSDASNPCTNPTAPCQTVARGIQNALGSRTVYVGSGTYAESVDLGGGKSLRSLTGAGVTRLNTVRVLSTGANRVDGFTLLGGTSTTDPSANVPLTINGPTTLVRGINFHTTTAQPVPQDMLVDSPTGGALAVSANNFSDFGAVKTKSALTIKQYAGSISVVSNQFHSYATAIEVLRSNAAPAPLTTIKSNLIRGVTDRGVSIVPSGSAPAASSVAMDGNEIREPAATTATGILASRLSGTSADLAFTSRLDKVVGYQTGVVMSRTTSAGLSNDAILGSTATGLASQGQSGVGDVTLTSVTFRDNALDISGTDNRLTLDSTLVEDPISMTAGGAGTCQIGSSRGPTTSGGPCQTFQTSAVPGYKDVPANDMPGSVIDDYQLSPTSPLLDLGNPVTPAGAVDIEGKPRAVEMVCNGARRDIGAHEVQGPDDCPPDTAFVLTPPSVSGSVAIFRYTSPSSDVRGFACTLRAGTGATQPVACPFDSTTQCVPSCEVALNGLASASPSGTDHTFTVTARDGRPNDDPTPATYTWRVDRQLDPGVGPDAQFFASAGTPATPPDPSGTAGLVFRYRSPHRDAVRFGCSLQQVTTPPTPPTSVPCGDNGDGGDNDGLTGQVTLDVAAGDLQLTVRAFDSDGNSGGTDVHAWTADPELNVGDRPDTAITAHPDDESPTDVTFRYESSSRDTEGYVCQLDDQPPFTCPGSGPAGGVVDLSVPEGPAHEFTVTAVDAEGNEDDTPARSIWRVGPLDTQITTGPDGSTTGASTQFEFSSTSVGVDHFECALDAGSFETCTSPTALTGLADGEHRLRVRAVDTGGYVEPTPAERGWNVVRVASNVTLKAPRPASAGLLTVTKRAKVRAGRLVVSLKAKAGAKVSGPVRATVTGTVGGKPVRLTGKGELVRGLGRAKVRLRGPAGQMKRLTLTISYNGNAAYNAPVLAVSSARFGPELVARSFRRGAGSHRWVANGPNLRGALQAPTPVGQVRLLKGQGFVVRGTVRDDAGAPIPAAPVTLSYRPRTGGASKQLTQTDSNAQGVFRIVVPARRSGTMTFHYDGDGDLYLPSEASLGTKVTTAATVELKRARTINHKRVITLTGRVTAKPIPATGVTVVLQRLVGVRWTKIRSTRAPVKPTGQFRLTYTRKTKAVPQIEEVRAFIVGRNGYSYQPGPSRQTVVLKIPPRKG